MSTVQLQVFEETLSNVTGLDPRVIASQQAAEGHPGDEPGYFNWLNIQTPTANSLGEPVKGTGPGNTAIFPSINVGMDAAIKELQSLGLGHEGGKTVAQQIQDIGQSGWASNPSYGSNIESIFIQHYGQSALQDPAQTSQPPSPAQSQAANVTGPSLAQTIPGVPQAESAVSSVTSSLTSVSSALSFIFSIRFLEIIGGGALVLVGIALLGNQFKKGALGAGVVAGAAAAPPTRRVPSTFRGEPPTPQS